MIILNETKVAEEILESGKLSKNTGSDIALLARYFVQKQGMTRKPAIAAIDSFLRKAQAGYNRVLSIDFIEKVVEGAKKKPLIELGGIPITKDDMEYIRSLDGVRKQRIAFICLCYAKYNNMKNDNDSNWSNIEVDELFKEARIPVKTDVKCQILHEMIVAGILSKSKNGKSNNLKVNFLDNDSEVVLFITDTRELAYEYMRYCGENIVKCKECGRLIKGNKQNTKTTCSDCLLSSEDYYDPMVNKTIKCLDCGEEFVVPSTSRTDVCDDCRLIRKRNQTRERVKKMREKNSQNAM